MRPVSLRSLALASGLSCLCARAQAQSTTTGAFSPNLEVLIDGEDVGNPMIQYINKRQCDAGLPIQITATALPSAPFVEVWRNNGAGDCSTAKDRTINTTTQGSACTQIGTAVTNPGMRETFNLTTSQAFVRDMEQGGECDLQGAQTVYIVPLQTQTPTSGSNVSEGLQVIKLTFTVDLQPPGTPAGASPESGENQIGLTWDAIEKGSDFLDYTVVYDTSGIAPAGEACTSTLLEAGAEVPDDENLVTQNSSGESIETSPGSVDLAVGDQIPAGVTARDKAGNLSTLSNLVCVQRVETSGFWDACQSDPNCRDDFDTCSLSHTNRGGALGLTLGALGLALWLRRRGSV